MANASIGKPTETLREDRMAVIVLPHAGGNLNDRMGNKLLMERHPAARARYFTIVTRLRISFTRVNDPTNRVLLFFYIFKI